MNEDKELEEAIEKLKKIITAKSSSGYEIALFDFGEDGSKTVLQALENSIPKKKIEDIYNNNEPMTITERVEFYQRKLRELLEDK